MLICCKPLPLLPRRGVALATWGGEEAGNTTRASAFLSREELPIAACWRRCAPCTDGAVPRHAHHKHSFSFWRGRAAGAGCESSDARRGGGHSGGPRTGRSWRHLQRASVKPLLLFPNSPLHKNDKMCRRPAILILAFFVEKILEVSKCTTGVQGNYTHSHSGPPRRVRPDFNPHDSILLEDSQRPQSPQAAFSLRISHLAPPLPPPLPSPPYS